MRAMVTGQVGMDKKPYLRAVQDFAGQQGETVELFNIGDIMYKEAPDIGPGTILNLPLSRLNTLRRAAFKDVIADSAGVDNIMVNTHATFRWRHGLFSAFDFDQVRRLEPELFICLVDNIESVHHRLHAEHDIDATLKDCMVWREEELLATELLSQAVEGSKFYIMARGRHRDTIRTMFRLVCRPDMRKVYPSFPMSHVVDMPDVLAEIDAFRDALAEHFITFDPGDVDEKLLLDRAIAAAQEGNVDQFLDVTPHSFGGAKSPGAERLRVRVREVLDIAGDIDGQIYMRDFKLIDQADMIVSYIPELPGKDGKAIPGLSSGVERELQHAWEHAKEVYVVWKPSKPPSPFITETSTKIFKSTDEALAHFEAKGMFADRNLFGN
ncbi:MAG: AAA family ATPase [Planctomycetota bacterium]